MTAEASEVLLGRYRVLRPLKDGHPVRTVLAEDLTTGAQVVVKTAAVPQLLAAARLRLEHEAAVLRHLQSPWVAPLLDFDRDGDVACLVTPLIPGLSLQERLNGGPLRLDDTLTLGHSLLAALRDVHDQGVLHRDVKPSNIIVSDETPLDRATLIDLGLARTEWLHPGIRDIPAGSVRYMSPEQAGLLERSPDERSDLYSAGAVLFECLAGRPLFSGSTLGEVLRLHLSAPLPDFADVNVQVPRAVEQVLGRLLAPDPDDRYQSADAALADVRAIAAALERGEAEPRIVVGARDRRRTLAEPAFVHRDEEMQALLTQVAQARAGAGGTVLVEAESGGGKSRLLEEFTVRAAAGGARLYRGQGVDQAAQRPFEVLRAVAAELLAQAQADPAYADLLRDQLAERRDALCAALPDLHEILGRGSDAVGPEAFGEIRTVEAIADLLDAIGSEERPAVILLDDGQWADELSLKVLLHRQQHAERPGRHTLVVVAFRTEEVEAGHPLRRLTTAERLTLAPLGAEQVIQLAESMAGPLPPEATEILIRLSDGIPFMAAAVLRGLVESGALVQEPTGWRTDPVALADVRASQRAAAFLARRIRLLPAEARDLLSVGAVLGKEFDPEFAAELAGQQATEAFHSLEETRRRHIIWIRADRCAFVHDKLRETFLELLTAEERARLHRLAAERLEERNTDSAFDLAFHFDAAGEPERALPYALVAAERARTQHALQAAQQQYEIAERGAPHAAVATRLAIAEGLGDVLMLRGLYDAAREQYETARDLAQDALSVARLEGKLGELAFKRGELEAANVALESALRSIGHRVPTGSTGFFLAAMKELVVQLLHTLLPRLFVARRADGPAEEFVAIRLHSRMAHTYWFSRGSLPTLWTHLRGMNLAERYAPTSELAQAYSEHAPVMTLIPYFKRGVRYSERSLKIRRDLGDAWGEGQSLHFLGIVLYGASRFEHGIERFREAVRLLDRTGDRWEVNTARWHLAFSLYRLGDLRGAAEIARSVYASGVEIGDAQARGIALGVWSKATGGHAPQELIEAELARPSHDVHTSSEVLQAQAVRLLAEGDPTAAVAVLEKAATMVREAGLRQEYVAPIWPWLTTALRQQAEAVPARLPRRRRQLLRKSARAARKARRLSRWYRNNLAHSLREAGLIAAMRGRSRRARRLLDRSLAVAEQLGMRHEHAESLLARATIGVELHWPGADADLRTARAILAEQEWLEADAEGETVTPSLIDRFDAILEAGRLITSALSRATVYAALRDAASTLLRGEHCLILEAPDGPANDLIPVAGHAPGEFSRVVARRALTEGRSVVLDEEAATDTSESVVLAGIRSVLCVPIHMHGRAVACLYTEHRRVGGLFGADEAKLAEFIAALAGAALENAQGFAEIQELTHTLGLRVDERAAELAEAVGEVAAARDAALAAAAASSTFLATMSHEIRTPLNAVIGFTGLLIDSTLSDEQRDLAQSVRASGEALLDIINDILDFSKIQAGELQIETAPFDVLDVIDTAVELVASTAAQKGLELVSTADPSCPSRVLGDVTRLRQIVVNLLSNAVKFTVSGHVAVHLRAESGPAPEDVTLHISVTDTGIGIAPEAVDRLFAPFSQVDASTTRLYGGTGLGLAISRRLAAAMDGEITVHSEPGAGSTFTCTVLVGRAPTQGPDAHGMAAPSLRSRSVLLVVPDGLLRTTLLDQLGSWGMRCQAVTDLAEAHALRAQGLSWDVALLEQSAAAQAPADAEELRRSPAVARMPLIAITNIGEALVGLDRRLFAGTISTPIRLRALRDALIRALERPNAIPAQATPHRTEPALPDGLRILLVEDNAVNQKVARLMLRNLGALAVDVAGNGLEAVAALTAQSYDVVLMDVQMPEMDGLEATRAIRRMSFPDGPPRIIAMTAGALAAEREACTAAGMDDYLPKPVRETALREALALVTVRQKPDAVDVAQLHSLFEQLGSSSDATSGLVQEFLTDCAEHLAGLRDAIADGRAEDVARTAHHIKSTTAMFGATELSRLLASAESLARAEAPATELVVMGQRVEEEFARVRSALDPTVGAGTVQS